MTFAVIIIGGGAAGFFTAAVLSEARPDLSILVLEKTGHPLAKVRISGGGRCNLTHAQYDPHLLVENYPRGSRELLGPLTRFGPAGVVRWFEQHGVPLKTEPDGRIFPQADDSAAVIDCLAAFVAPGRARLWQGAAVQKISPAADGLRISLADGQQLDCRRALLATGGDRQGFRLAGGAGHTIVPPVPSLFSLKIPDPRLQDLAGVSVPDTALWLEGSRRPQRGPLLITHWGLSGPAVLRLSAWEAHPLAAQGYRAGLRVNWLPAHTEETLTQALLDARSLHPRQKITHHDPTGYLPQRLWNRLAEAALGPHQATWGAASPATLRALAQALTAGRFDVAGKGPFKDEFVTAGGVDLKEVDFKTMHSRVLNGLHLAGEVLNIDGLTGGFNFQNAWTTAWVAAQAMATAL